MNKKAFTLLELLGVITILGLIAAIVFPAISSMLNSSREDAYDSQIKIVEKAAQAYYIDNPNLLPDLSEQAVVNVQTLISGGYIENDKLVNNQIKDPRKKDGYISGCVKVSLKNNQYQYNYNESCE